MHLLVFAYPCVYQACNPKNIVNDRKVSISSATISSLTDATNTATSSSLDHTATTDSITIDANTFDSSHSCSYF